MRTILTTLAIFVAALALAVGIGSATAQPRPMGCPMCGGEMEGHGHEMGMGVTG